MQSGEVGQATAGLLSEREYEILKVVQTVKTLNGLTSQSSWFPFSGLLMPGIVNMKSVIKCT